MDKIGDLYCWVCKLLHLLWEPFGNTHHKALKCTAYLLTQKYYLKEISMGIFLSSLSYNDVPYNKILIRKTLSIEMVRGAGEDLELLWNGWAEPVSIFLDHTEHLVLKSLAKGQVRWACKWQWCIWWSVVWVCLVCVFFPFWWKFFRVVSFKFLWIGGQIYSLAIEHLLRFG